MELHPDTLAVLKAFNRNVEWLKMQSVKAAPPVEAWCDYEAARKILDRSKHWYNRQRNSTGLLFKGNDWRYVGGKVEYKVASVHNLKKLITR